jgi:S-DNA-T family DNA segregation ATPase FtsK/SpoIIIE
VDRAHCRGLQLLDGEGLAHDLGPRVNGRLGDGRHRIRTAPCVSDAPETTLNTMKLHVVCRSADEVRDLEIEAGAESRVADLTEGAGLVVDGRRVGPQVLLADAGLYEGAVIDITDQPPAVSPGDVTEHERVLAIVGGVAAGRTFPLTGDTVIGRDVSCDIVLDDPAVSPRHARVTDDGDVVDLGSTNGTWVGDGLIRIGATQLRVRSIDDRDRPSTARDGMTIPFNRPPRPAPPTPPVEPALAPATRSFGAAMVLGPLLMAGAMVAIYGDPRFAVFAVLAPVTAAITWITAKGAARSARVRP